MVATVERWVAGQHATGFLPYGFDFLADADTESREYPATRMVRQAGAASALADRVQLVRDARAEATLRALIEALQRHSLPIGKRRLQSLLEQARLLSLPVGRHKLHAALTRFDLLYLPEGPGLVVSASRSYDDAHTGSTALALLAEVRYRQATGDDRFAQTRTRWVEALLGLRIPGRGFRLLPTSIDHVAFYDGEAWAALAEYALAFPDDARVARELAAIDEDLIRTYTRPFKLDFFHWGTMAAAVRYRGTGDPRILDFVTFQLTEFLRRRESRSDDENACSLLEGAADGLGTLVRAGQGTSPLAERTRAWLARETARALALQIRPGQEGIAFPNATLSAPRMREFAGDFLEGSFLPRTQVDLSSHCLSALVKLKRQALLSPGAPASLAR